MQERYFFFFIRNINFIQRNEQYKRVEKGQVTPRKVYREGSKLIKLRAQHLQNEKTKMSIGGESPLTVRNFIP